jgi:hypothetical protein
MTGAEIVRAAIPGASAELCEHILWGRTPFPVGRVTARDLYQAPSRFHRAMVKKVQLCDFCDRIVQEDAYLCETCANALSITDKPQGNQP